MFATILSFLNNLFSMISKGIDYTDKKDTENAIKNSYEKDKHIDALEETQKAEEIIKVSEENSEEAQKTINVISNVSIEDSKLTEEEIIKELDTIEEDKKEIRELELIMAKEIKEKAEKTQKEIESNDEFNSGEEFIFKG